MMHLQRALLFAFGVAALLPAGMSSGQGRAGKRGPQNEIFHTDVPGHAFDIILGRPARTSVTTSVLACQNMEGCLEYGATKGACASRTRTVRFKGSCPKNEMALEVLWMFEPASRRGFHECARYHASAPGIPGNWAPLMTPRLFPRGEGGRRRGSQ